MASLVALRNNRWVAVNVLPILSWNTNLPFFLQLFSTYTCFLLVLSKYDCLSLHLYYHQISLSNSCTSFWETGWYNWNTCINGCHKNFFRLAIILETSLIILRVWNWETNHGEKTLLSQDWIFWCPNAERLEHNILFKFIWNLYLLISMTCGHPSFIYNV